MVGVGASGVFVGGTFLFEDVRPLQAVRNNTSKLMPAHITDVPVDLLRECFTSLLDKETKKYISIRLTHAEMNAHVNITVIV